MPSSIDKFAFKKPKQVRSGKAIALDVAVSVVNGPKTLVLSASGGYACDPPNIPFDTGEHADTVDVMISGPSGFCEITGTLGISQRLDIVEVT